MGVGFRSQGDGKGEVEGRRGSKMGAVKAKGSPCLPMNWQAKWTEKRTISKFPLIARCCVDYNRQGKPGNRAGLCRC